MCVCACVCLTTDTLVYLLLLFQRSYLKTSDAVSLNYFQYELVHFHFLFGERESEVGLHEENKAALLDLISQQQSKEEFLMAPPSSTALVRETELLVSHKAAKLL